MNFQDDELKEILNIFRVESEEIIERLNNTLLELEKSPSNKDLIVFLFREAHSLKGAARMIGFSKTQDIAHKIEDILGLAKEDKLELTSEISDVMYKSVDIISKIISASIEKGKEIDTEDETQNIIETLENIKLNGNNIQNSSKPISNTEFNQEYFINNINIINSLIKDTILNIVKLTENITEEPVIKIFEQTSELIKHFQIINDFDIKSELETINLKLEVIIKCNTQLSYAEVEELQQKTDNIVSKISDLCAKNNLEVIDYYEYAFSEKMSPTKSNPQLNFENLKEKINSLTSSTQNIDDLITEFDNLHKLYSTLEISPLLSKISELFVLIKKTNTTLDESRIEILKNCSHYCFDTLENKNPAENIGLLMQQLTIAGQLIELENPITAVQSPESDKFKPKDFSNNNKIQNKKFKDISKLLNSGEIKTLHVESSKLDSMVNQIGELISTKIKITKRLSEISLLEKDFEEWQKDFSKILQTIKLQDKTFSQTEFQKLTDNRKDIQKQIISSLSEQNKNLNSLISNFSQIQRSIIEDDTKMRLLIDDFDSMIKNIRILPLATVFHLFGRMVRDIAKERGKEVELIIKGSETSADKKIIEEIKNPLIHIIRNSIDHGIETPEKRIQLGKPPKGQIQINAKHLENHILIEIIDDGQGFNIEKIKSKALNQGFLTETELSEMSDEEIINLVFLPGFTTGDEVTSISGRGIGMDIVKSKIAQLNGTVNVISEFNKGTKIQIKLPVTMATMPAFLIQTSSQTFAVPMSVINSVICKKKDDFIQNKENFSILHNNKNIPLYNLSDLLNLKPSEETSKLKTILIIETNNQTAGIIADKLLGEQEIIQKKLSPPLYKLKNISGITTLASGETCLILNILDLMKNASQIKTKILSSETQASIVDTQNILKNKKILIVDDSKTIRTMEKNILTNADFYVETAENPIEALQILNRQHFDIIISDIEMPQMNGLEFLSNVKSNELFCDIPFIIISSVTDETVKRKALSLGAENFIIKASFNQKNFVNEISKTLIKYSD